MTTVRRGCGPGAAPVGVLCCLLALVQRTMKSGTFEQALDAELRWPQRDVEERFSYWVDHLQ